MKMRRMWRKLNAPRDHRWAMPRFSAYVEGDLPARQHRRLHDHEGICPECRQAIRSLKKLLSALPKLGADKPTFGVGDRTARSVLDRIEREPPPAG